MSSDIADEYGYPIFGIDSNFMWIHMNNNLTLLVRKRNMTIIAANVTRIGASSTEWYREHGLYVYRNEYYRIDDYITQLNHQKCGLAVHYYDGMIVCEQCNEIIK